MSHLDLLLVQLENEDFWEKFQSHYRMLGGSFIMFFFYYRLYLGGFCWFDKISRQVKSGRWSDILLICIPEYDLEQFSDNLQKVWSITEPVLYKPLTSCVYSDGVSNQPPPHCSLNRLFGRRSRKTLTHWGRDKWPSFSRRHFQLRFLEWKCLNSDWNFTEFCS